jgi:hypothetical protein
VKSELEENERMQKWENVKETKLSEIELPVCEVRREVVSSMQ